MTSFYKFVKQEESKATLALPGADKSAEPAVMRAAISNGIAGLISSVPHFPIKDADRFGRQLTELVTNDSFLTSFSEAIELPKQGETEDEFVRRSKLVLRGLIDQKLNAK